MNCRFCKAAADRVVIDLVNSPPSNSFLAENQLAEPEVFYPLKVFLCENCFLMQLDEYKKHDDIFNSQYVYFSSFSATWLQHCRKYVDTVVPRFGLDARSLVIEIASNDGYLLQYFKQHQVPVLGIEPTANTAAVAIEKGIDTEVEFFGVALAERLAAQGKYADLLLGNNVLAHVPDVNDFVAGISIVLAEKGVVTMEFPHLLQLVWNNQFDTIYHEHFSYFSFHTVKRIFEACGLLMFDVEELPTHGGSLRIYACHAANTDQPVRDTVPALLEKEVTAGINTVAFYEKFADKVKSLKADFVKFVLDRRGDGKTICGYGAAAKGNTLLNYYGIKNDVIDFVVDANPAKQGMYLPGSHIPVVNEAVLKQAKPDFVVIFPWNIKDEISSQLDYIREWGGQFIVPVPQLQIL